MRPPKLSPAAIAEIRGNFAARRAIPTNKQMAKKHDVSHQLISQIGNGDAYVELCEPASGFDGAESKAQRRSG